MSAKLNSLSGSGGEGGGPGATAAVEGGEAGVNSLLDVEESNTCCLNYCQQPEQSRA